LQKNNFTQSFTENAQRATEQKEKNNMEINQITEKIIGCAIEVHKCLGPGLLESAYEECLVFELQNVGLIVEKQKPVPVIYKEIKLDCGYRIDILVENTVLIELKTVDAFNPVHEAQILTYMKFSKKSIGLLINFNVTLLKNGLKRYKI
jgi:GxxExxY protein